ncbi:MAG: serine/threonine-protein kinase, partial [Myxococcales bacterium]|nr:serine/threonine-protein kinase [Polyangiaceae bacterium]MDW8251385.1 serine/threonine-protein kinase [Myxococcales bacterium]
MSAPVVGEVIAGKYRVDRVIGQGGMGVVLAATHLQLDGPVALKCMLPEAARSPEALARFLQEARTCARLRSDRIVRVFDVGVLPDGAPFLVMELLEGKDLAEHLAVRGPLPVDEVIGYALEVCEGLAEAHAQGIVHRDLKPSNLFVVPRKSGGRGSVKILDFGISKLLSPMLARGEALAKTGEAAFLGSPFYMPPEQISSAAQVDGRADIWALGVVLYELCTGQRPFVADSAPALVGKIFSEDPPPSRSLRPEVPPWLESVILRCLRRDPKLRYPNVQALAQALSEGVKGGGLEATAPVLSGQDHQVILEHRRQFQQQTLETSENAQRRPEVSRSVAAPEVDLSEVPWGEGQTLRSDGQGRRWLLTAGVGVVMVGLGFGFWGLRQRMRPLRIRGSSTLGLQVIPRWRELLEREGIRVEVASPGTTRGLDALLTTRGEGLAAASRRATPDELARSQGQLREHLVGYDAIAIVVHVDNDVPRLTIDQLRGLFGGKVTSWSEVGGSAGAVHLLMRPEELGGYEALQGLLGKDLRFVEGAEVIRTNEEVVRRVSADRQAVTFASFTVTGPVRHVPVGKGEGGPFVAPST